MKTAINPLGLSGHMVCVARQLRLGLSEQAAWCTSQQGACGTPMTEERHLRKKHSHCSSPLILSYCLMAPKERVNAGIYAGQLACSDHCLEGRVEDSCWKKGRVGCRKVSRLH